MWELCAGVVIDSGCVLELTAAHSSSWLTRPVRPHSEPPNGPSVVADAVAELPAVEAHALWLVDVCGCSYLEGALEMRIDRDTFSRHVRSGRRRLRHLLGGHH